MCRWWMMRLLLTWCCNGLMTGRSHGSSPRHPPRTHRQRHGHRSSSYQLRRQRQRQRRGKTTSSRRHVTFGRSIHPTGITVPSSLLTPTVTCSAVVSFCRRKLADRQKGWILNYLDRARFQWCNRNHYTLMMASTSPVLLRNTKESNEFNYSTSHDLFDVSL